MIFSHEYPVVVVPDETDGGFIVTFPDFPEAITQADDFDTALEEAEDCLEEVVANRIMMNADLPPASPRSAGQAVVAVPAPTAVKAAFYCAIRDLHASKVQIAALLGIDEKEVRRLLNPYHPSKLNRINELLRKLGKRLVIQIQDSPDAAAEAPTQSRATEGATQIWDALRQNAGNLYVLPRRLTPGPVEASPGHEVAS